MILKFGNFVHFRAFIETFNVTFFKPKLILKANQKAASNIPTECETTQRPKPLHSYRPKSNSPSLLEQTNGPDAKYKRKTHVRWELQHAMNASFEWKVPLFQWDDHFDAILHNGCHNTQLMFESLRECSDQLPSDRYPLLYAYRWAVPCHMLQRISCIEIRNRSSWTLSPFDGEASVQRLCSSPSAPQRVKILKSKKKQKKVCLEKVLNNYRVLRHAYQAFKLQTFLALRSATNPCNACSSAPSVSIFKSKTGCCNYSQPAKRNSTDE